TVAIIKKNKKKIFLTLNRPVINRNGRRIVRENIKRLKDLKLDGFIVSDLGLIDQLKDCGVKIIASSIIETKNEEVVKLLKRLNIRRIIFDRQITLNDMKNIIPKFPEIEFETFVMSAGCRSLISYCRRKLITKKDKQHIHLCFADFLIEASKKANPFLDSNDRKIVAARLKMPMICCGACALFQFERFKIASVKIVGRGFPSAQKIQSVKFVKSALNILEQGHSKNKFYKKMEELFQKTYRFKCQRRFCYYPHFFNK
ncbi:U32 family peptidase, partial [Patescibacteria group bacterium]|nr:U32 family peptidase [Patescibacteria group bacterium]